MSARNEYDAIMRIREFAVKNMKRPIKICFALTLEKPLQSFKVQTHKRHRHLKLHYGLTRQGKNCECHPVHCSCLSLYWAAICCLWAS